jgi:hypothetical protein
VKRAVAPDNQRNAKFSGSVVQKLGLPVRNADRFLVYVYLNFKEESMPYKIYPAAAADASTAFQLELDSHAIDAIEELEAGGIRGEAREAILRKHLGADYDKGYRGTAYGLHGISAGLTPAKLAEMLDAHGEPFDPCEERDTYDHSMMVNVELELDSQLEFIPDSVLEAVVEDYKRELIGG